MTSAIDSALSGAVERGDLLGVVAAAATAAGPLYEGAFGERVLGGGAPMSTDTVLWIASMTKPITGAAAMQLVERGLLQLDRPARHVIPALGDLLVLDGFDDIGRPRLRPPRSEITLRRLLTHTAGFGYDVWDESLRRYQRQHPTAPTPLLFDPGDRWMYGTGIDWAGELVEAVSGLSLGRYFDENIFRPLGMTSTRFGVVPEDRKRLAVVHTRGDDGTFAPSSFKLLTMPATEAGGGGLYSTVGDYLRFCRAILEGGALDGTRILRPETVAYMGGNHLGPIEVTTLVPAIPKLSNPANFFPGMSQKWGLTFLINSEDSPGRRRAGSLAWGGLANSYFWIDPTAGVCGVWATQLLPFADSVSLDCFSAFEGAVYASIG